MRRPYPRFLAARLREALDDPPPVLSHGPRQSGKATLARSVGERRGYRYLSFDQDVLTGRSTSDARAWSIRCARLRTGTPTAFGTASRSPAIDEIVTEVGDVFSGCAWPAWRAAQLQLRRSGYRACRQVASVPAPPHRSTSLRSMCRRPLGQLPPTLRTYPRNSNRRRSAENATSPVSNASPM
jgi:hypothetical protein